MNSRLLLLLAALSCSPGEGGHLQVSMRAGHVITPTAGPRKGLHHPVPRPGRLVGARWQRAAAPGASACALWCIGRRRRVSRIDSGTQRARDTDRRRILEQELTTEQQASTRPGANWTSRPRAMAATAGFRKAGSPSPTRTRFSSTSATSRPCGARSRTSADGRGGPFHGRRWAVVCFLQRPESCKTTRPPSRPPLSPAWSCCLLGRGAGGRSARGPLPQPRGREPVCDEQPQDRRPARAACSVSRSASKVRWTTCCGTTGATPGTT